MCKYCLCVYIYIYIHTCVYISIYLSLSLYIYIERERDVPSQVDQTHLLGRGAGGIVARGVHLPSGRAGYLSIYLSLSLYIYIYIYMYMHTYIRTYAYAYIYIYTQIHTYTCVLLASTCTPRKHKRRVMSCRAMLRRTSAEQFRTPLS